MEKIINYENIRSFAYVNDGVCKKPIKGIMLSFFGLGGMTMFAEDTVEGEYYGQNGILYVIPYYDPWSWMNKQAVAFTDEILDVLIDKYGLNDSIPIVSTGGSMGGLSSLVYMVYAKRTPVACVANCPVCDAAYHYTERIDLPRTMYSAVFNEPGSLEDALASISPVHLADKMPKSKYYIMHCDKDEAVNIDKHSGAFVSAMKERGHDITFDIVPGRGHCDLPYEKRKLFAKYVIDAVEAAGK